jgi:hypothetical protein
MEFWGLEDLLWCTKQASRYSLSNLSWQGEEIVVKHFKPTCVKRLREEIKMLKIVKQEPKLQNRTTEIVGETDEEGALLLRPKR